MLIASIVYCRLRFVRTVLRSLRCERLASLAIHWGLLNASGILSLGLSLALITGSSGVEILALVGVLVLILVLNSLRVIHILRTTSIPLVGILLSRLLGREVARGLRSILWADAWWCRHSLTKLACLLEWVVLGRIWNMRRGGGSLRLTLATLS